MMVNDYLVLPLQEGTKAPLAIYDRWGNEIFSSKNYQNDWKAKNLPNGIYFIITQTNKSTYINKLVKQ